MAEQSFPASHRLLKSSEFDLIFKQCDRRLANSSLLVLAKRNQRGFNRLGMVVSKRNMPRAVDRNRIKRLIREAFRKIDPIGGEGLDFIVLPRAAARTDKRFGALIDESFEAIIKQDN